MEERIGGQTDTEEAILRFDISDEALERAAEAGGGHAITWQFCTHVWYDCGWPQ